ncbi:UNVERIFIED_CONTAM: hypothetical protein GTU68_025737 [Idotea baltica]|nr:hypothetical protein [Idotea baltica]
MPSLPKAPAWSSSLISTKPRLSKSPSRSTATPVVSAWMSPTRPLSPRSANRSRTTTAPSTCSSRTPVTAHLVVWI